MPEVLADEDVAVGVTVADADTDAEFVADADAVVVAETPDPFVDDAAADEVLPLPELEAELEPAFPNPEELQIGLPLL